MGDPSRRGGLEWARQAAPLLPLAITSSEILATTHFRSGPGHPLDDRIQGRRMGRTEITGVEVNGHGQDGMMA